MQAVIQDLRSAMDALDAELPTVDKTAASAQRARKLTLDLARLGKQFREESIAFHKKK